jgi:hypothetical protein
VETRMLSAAWYQRIKISELGKPSLPQENNSGCLPRPGTISAV